ncbi:MULTISPECIES: sulfite exporter TauE/SafE family protein [unclassified Solibacillus]|uniref:sulfite exporter TauE/SafE family protein n=1 Tax=unclassified Solibacillus TaxID=2637870 RepID=UPI0030FD0D10
MICLENLLIEWLSFDGLILFGIGLLAALVGVMFGAAGFVLLPSLLLVGIPIHATVAINKFATGISSFSTVIVLTMKKRVDLKKMIPFMLIAAVGGISGAFLATRLSEQTMNIVACIVLIVMFIFVIKSNKKSVVNEQPEIEEKTTLIAPFLIGIYDGGLGTGSALLNITYFLKKQFSYVMAAEMTRFVMFASCTTAFLFYLFYGIVNWGVAVPVAVGSIVGSQIGLKIIPYLKGKWIEILLPIIFFLLIVQVIADLLF